MRTSEVTEDLYALLAVPADAHLQEIKRAYRRRARELHPDAYGDRATEDRFHAVTVAYETLRDPDLRRRYDQGRRQAEDDARARRAEQAERRRREEAALREAERRRHEEARRREAERRLREEADRRRREEGAARYEARRQLAEETAREERTKARTIRALFTSAALCCLLGPVGALLTLEKRDAALQLYDQGVPAIATVQAFQEERVPDAGQPGTEGVSRQMTVAYSDAGGRRRRATLKELRRGYREGQRVAVVYDRGGGARVALADPCGAGRSLACGRNSLPYLGLSAFVSFAGLGLLTGLRRRRRILSPAPS